MWFRAKIAPGERDEGCLLKLSCLLKLLIGSLDFLARGQRVITINSSYNEAHDDLTFNVIGATMAYYDLTFNVIGATMAYYDLTFNILVQLWHIKI